MSRYKLLSLDMDGTALNSQKRISPVTAAAIKKLIESGVHVVFGTGRGLPELTDYKDVMRGMHYGILVSGAVIYDFFENRPISITPLKGEDSLKILQAAENERAMVQIMTVNQSVVKGEDIANMADFNMSIYREMYERVCTRVEDPQKSRK